MSFKYGDRVQETFTTTGTGTISLGGAVTGYQAFSSALNNGDTCYYAATDGTNWEVGLGTFTSSGDTLARTTVIASSNSGSAVNWSAGTKNIWLDIPATACQTPINVQTFTSGGTYTPTAGMVFCIIEVWGGGGAGGAGSSTSGGAGGGSGGYALAIASAATIGASQTVTVGAANGTSSVGSIASASGGSNGTASSSNTWVAGGAPGAGSIGNIQAGGAPGMPGGTTSTGSNFEVSGTGGSTSLGGGGLALTTTSNTAGNAGRANTGSGGSGGCASGAGGAGATGFVKITEFLI